MIHQSKRGGNCSAARPFGIERHQLEARICNELHRNVNDFYKAVMFSNMCTLSWKVMENRLQQVFKCGNFF